MLSKNKNTQNLHVTGKLQRRARIFSKVLMLLFEREQMRGRIRDASRGARYLSLGVQLAEPRQLPQALKMSEAIALAANAEAVIATRQAGRVVYQFELPDSLWQFFTRDDLPDPAAVGMGERRKPVMFQFDEARPHTMIAGATGSGKTEAIKTALLALLQSTTPDDARIVLIDIFNNFAGFENAAHLAFRRATTPREIEAALQFCEAELAHRIERNIKDGPHTIIVCDEAERVLNTPAAVEKIKAIAKTGRQFRVNLILGSQQFKEADLPGVTRELNNRFVGLVNDAQTSSKLTGHAGLFAHRLTGKGDFLHVAGPDVVRFQVAQARAKDFDLLERTEARPVPVADSTTIELPVMPEPPPGRGRPKIELDPALLAYYYHHGPKVVTHAHARAMGLTRTAHVLHRDAIMTFGRALLKIRRDSQWKPQ